MLWLLTSIVLSLQEVKLIHNDRNNDNKWIAILLEVCILFWYYSHCILQFKLKLVQFVKLLNVYLVIPNRSKILPLLSTRGWRNKIYLSTFKEMKFPSLSPFRSLQVKKNCKRSLYRIFKKNWQISDLIDCNIPRRDVKY